MSMVSSTTHAPTAITTTTATTVEQQTAARDIVEGTMKRLEELSEQQLISRNALLFRLALLQKVSVLACNHAAMQTRSTNPQPCFPPCFSVPLCLCLFLYSPTCVHTLLRCNSRTVHCNWMPSLYPWHHVYLGMHISVHSCDWNGLQFSWS